MLDKVTSVMDVLGSAALVVGVGVVAGIGWALVALGVALLALSWGLSGRPFPRSGK
jgi:hypothetical protein